MKGTNDWVQFLAILENRSSVWELLVQEKVGGKNERGINLSGIVNGGVSADTMDYAPGDASCCPSRQGKTEFRVIDGKLVEISSTGPATSK
jgi:hypothetical protein